MQFGGQQYQKGFNDALENYDLSTRHKVFMMAKRMAAQCVKDKAWVAERCIEPELRNRFMKAETFVIDASSYVCDEKANDILATYKDMEELGINKPPYNDLIVYLVVDNKDNPGIFFRGIFLMVNPKWPDIAENEKALDFVLLAPHETEERYKELLLDEQECRNEADTAITVLIVLLATRGIITERKTSHTITSRTKSGTGGITYLSAPQYISDSNGHSGISCRPHLRRGHIRRQHYGIGNTLEKKIWVEPCFVNGEPEQAREAYVTKGAAA